MTSIIDLAQVNQEFNNQLVEIISADQVGVIALAAAITIGLTALATALAEGRIGETAIEMMTKHKNVSFGKLMLMVVIPESIIVFGIVIAILMVLLLRK